MKGKIYYAMLSGTETVPMSTRQETEVEVTELKMMRSSLGVTRMDKIRNEHITGHRTGISLGTKKEK